MSWQDEEFDRRVRAALEHGVANLDGETRSRLADARRMALAQPRAGWRWAPFSMQYGMAAALMAGWLAVGVLLHGKTEILATDNPFGEIALLEAEGDPDILTDPAFYAWVDTVLQGEPDSAG
jgi:hypothetical protein